MDKFTYNMFYEIEKPTVILSSVSHKHYGVLENVDMDSFNCNFNMNSAQEISFDVYKYFDEHLCSLWDKLISFKYIYIPQHHEYYKIDVSLDQDDKTVKHVMGTSAGEYELGQRKIRSLEINTELDITKTEKLDEITGKYVEVENTVENSGYTILYNPDNPEKSLLDRALHDRAPDWSIAHVDKTISSKQRTFSVSEQTIYDFFTNTVANELNCLFKFDSVNRTISVYDLLNTCTNSECNYRGEFTDKCPKCGNTEYIRGYGHDSHIHISAANYANKITVDGDEGSVKNCFKVTGGDDLMSATIKNSNPSGSEFIYKFSDADLDDMPDGLRDALIAYYEDYDRLNAQYQECLKDYYNALNTYYYYKTSMMPRFNAEYHHWQPNQGYDVGNKVYVITLPSWCYLECIQAGTSGSEEFDATYLDDSGDPSNPTIIEDGTVKWKVVKHIVEIPAASQAMNDVVAYLANANNKIYFEPVADSDPLNKADTTISRYVEDLIRSLINPLFKVEILEDGRTWDHTTGTNTGTLAFYLKITNTTNPNEVVTSKDKDSQGRFIWNNGNALVAHCQVAGNAQELENYLLQLTKKRMDRKDTKFQSLWEIEEDSKFIELLKQYSLDLLDGFAKSYGDCRDVLLANGIKDSSSKFHGVNLYNQVYAPYNTRLGYIDAEIKTREETVKYWYNDPDQKDDSTSDIPVGKKVPYDGSMPPGQVQVAYNAMVAIQKQLDLKNALGEYWSTFFNYIREGEYNNSNYISDGLSNNLLVDDANELLGKARLELEKASELQYTLSDDLNNLLNTEEFAPFKDKFKLGDFIMCGVGDSGEASDLDMDDHLYKLRLIQVSYQYNSPGSLSVTFSNVTKIKNYFSDTQDVLAQAKSMGTSYNAVTQQVERNKETTNQVNTWNTNGLNSALVKILNNNNEEVTYDNSGITLREYDYSYDTKEEHSDPSETYSSNDQGYNNKQLRITHNMLAFTTDNWKTASLALGELNYTYFTEQDVKVDNAVGYGLISQFVTAGTINGSQIIGGKLYSTNYSTLNPAGTRMDLDTGDLSVGGGKLKYTAGTGKLEIDGKIIATEGRIGGFDITANALYKNVTSLDDTSHNGIYIGSTNSNIGIRNQNGNNYVLIENGSITANNVNLKAGKIGSDNSCWNIGAKSIYNGTNSITDSSHNGTYVGIDGIRNQNGNNYVQINNGQIKANKADIKGDIEATSFSGESDTTKYGINELGLYIDGTGGSRIPLIDIKLTNNTYTTIAGGSMIMYSSGKGGTIIGTEYTNGNVTRQCINISSALSVGGGAVAFTEDGNGRLNGRFTVGQLTISNPDTTSTTNDANMYIDTSGIVRKKTGSSIRFKHDFNTKFNNDLDPHNLYNINVYQYKYQTNYLTNTKDFRYDTDVIGFIAEDIEKYYPVAVDKYHDERKDKDMIADWNSKFIIPPMLKLIQEQHEEIETLKREVKQLKNGGN